MEKKKKVIIAITIIVVIAIIFGLLYSSIFKEKSKMEIYKLGLTLQDVPYGYEKGDESYNSAPDEKMSISYPGIQEYYNVYFFNYSSTNNDFDELYYKEIQCNIFKYESIDSAKISFYSFTNIDLPSSASNDIIDAGPIGDESFLMTTNVSERQENNYSETILTFRVSNLIVSINNISESAEDNVPMVVNLAKIVEKRIYDVMI